jgi:hypothetical protein
MVMDTVTRTPTELPPPREAPVEQQAPCGEDPKTGKATTTDWDHFGQPYKPPPRPVDPGRRAPRRGHRNHRNQVPEPYAPRCLRLVTRFLPSAKAH